MSLWMAFLMVPGYAPRPPNTLRGWLGFGVSAFCVLQIVLFGELLRD
jgi:hypothetical protein